VSAFPRQGGGKYRLPKKTFVPESTRKNGGLLSF